MSILNLSETDILTVKGIGEKTSNLCHKLGVFSVMDFLNYFPREYETYPEICNVSDLVEDNKACIYAIVIGTVFERKVKGLTLTSLQAGDSTGRITITFFNRPYMKKSLKTGNTYCFYGNVKKIGSKLTLDQPTISSKEEYEKLQDGLWPVYSLTSGITNHFIRKALMQILSTSDFSDDPLSKEIQSRYELCSLKEAYQNIHFPEDLVKQSKARKRLAFDEFLTFLYSVRKLKSKEEEYHNVFPMIDVSDTNRLIEALPYHLTKGQEETWQEIKSSLLSKHVMNRLVQGDVGCGKTILAFLSIIMSAANGYQSALMAPTEVLARQHFEDIKNLTDKYHLPLKPVLLTGSVKGKERKEANLFIETGMCNVVIGTHALIQDTVNYKNLALVITDEQHRFGVHQRVELNKKGDFPHVLVMSATPIPRTLAMILYGDLQISAIHELPSNRLPIKNCVILQKQRDTAYKFMEKELASGRQAFCICPMIEESEGSNLENVTEYTLKLKQKLPDSAQIATLHGKMKPQEKNKIMEAFLRHDIDVLVSTTVIEVGINIPNATVMLIENAERYGLAQLHQLRGRVGRGSHQSYCIFISSNDKKETLERLDVLNHSNDGFYIANQDLKMRGPGDLFGIRQSGDLIFKIGDILEDSDLFMKASKLLEELELRPDEELTKFLDSFLTNYVDFPSI